jgi:hypothetical protein
MDNSLSVTVEREPGCLLVTMRVIRAAEIFWRRFHAPPGTSLEAMLARASGMVLERWPGGVMYQLALPGVDTGHDIQTTS